MIQPPHVEAVFASYPDDVRRKLLALRQLILDTASSIGGVGPIEETLKWGEPAYLTSQTKAGTTVRLGWKPTAPGQYAMYLNCNTDLIESFRRDFPDLRCVGKRAVVFDVSDELPVEVIACCIERALTYHLRKRKKGT